MRKYDVISALSAETSKEVARNEESGIKGGLLPFSIADRFTAVYLEN